jgi:hypothetical protein
LTDGQVQKLTVGDRIKLGALTGAGALFVAILQRRGAMCVKVDAGSSRFAAVISMDADKRGDAVNLIFNTRIEGQGAALRIALTSPQWETLKFLVDGLKPAGG